MSQTRDVANVDACHNIYGEYSMPNNEEVME